MHGGELIMAKDFNTINLVELSQYLKNKSAIPIAEIYFLDCINYPTFDSIKLKPKIMVKNNELRKSEGGLIFTEKEPVLMVIEAFHLLDVRDQMAFSGLITRRSSQNFHLHPDSVLILGISSKHSVNSRHTGPTYEVEATDIL